MTRQTGGGWPELALAGPSGQDGSGKGREGQDRTGQHWPACVKGWMVCSLGPSKLAHRICDSGSGARSSPSQLCMLPCLSKARQAGDAPQGAALTRPPACLLPHLPSPRLPCLHHGLPCACMRSARPPFNERFLSSSLPPPPLQAHLCRDPPRAAAAAGGCPAGAAGLPALPSWVPALPALPWANALSGLPALPALP